LNKNPIPLNANFLKKLKKNKSLTDLYMSDNNINSNDVDSINRVISNTNIQNLYLYENNITDCNEFLKIIYRTKLIKDDNNTDMIKTNSILMNLDLSKNIVSIKNSQHIKLLTTIIAETTLSCLDISHILLGKHPDKYEKVSENEIYEKNVQILKKKLEEQKKNSITIIKEINNKNIDIKRLEKLNLENINKFKQLNYKIYEIIKDKKSIFPLFLKQEANKLIQEENNKYNGEINNKIDMIKKEDEKSLINYMMIKKLKQDIKPLIEKRNERKLIIC
jgi:hypothetical protein